MTADVHTLSPDATAFDAWRTILSNRIRQVPIVENETVKGIVSRTDLMRKAQHIEFDDNFEQRLQIDEVMTEDPVTIEPKMPIKEAAAKMHRHKLSALPVTENQQLVGILTKTDMFRAMSEILEYNEPEQVHSS